jgi:aryl-alcohol dehydrogenase-like predicted oxidoreductase
VIATKFGHRFHAERMQQPGWEPGSVRSDHWSPGEVVRQLEASLRALGTDYIDIYQSHGGSDADVDTPGLWDALQAQVQAGKIRHLGLSIDAGDAARARKALQVGAGVVQVPYSRLQRDAEPEVLPTPADLGIGVLAREPLANGYLSGKYGREPRGPCGHARSTLGSLCNHRAAWEGARPTQGETSWGRAG